MTDIKTEQLDSPDDAPLSGVGAAPLDEKSAAARGDGEEAGEEATRDQPTEPPASAAKEAPKPEGAREGAPLLTKGNPLRLVRGGITAAVGALLAFLLMAHNGQLRFGVPLGALFCAISCWGIMDLLGTFDDAVEPRSAVTLEALAWPIARVFVGLLFWCSSLYSAQMGWGNQWMWGIVVTLTFLAWVAAIFDLGVKLGPWAKDELGLDRPITKRHGFWVVAAGAFLYLPAMGLYSLWDPWETHYGEVAREILARDDWISLWWAQDGWFWSKPILNFWIQAIAMATLGTHYKSDQMLIGNGGLPVAHPEWVVRAPNVLMTIVAMYVLYKGVAKVFGRRAGMLGALVLATMPDWFFLAHQTMTDMPFVAAMTAAMGLLLLGLHTSDDARCAVYEVKAGKTTWRLSGWHLAFGAILLCALPQILYLLSRNLELVLHGPGDHGFRPHFDEFHSGSAGNCGLPGNEACLLAQPASIPKSVGAHPDGLWPILLRTFGAFEPFLQGIVWAVVIGALLYVNWGERRLRRLFYVGAWLCAAIATMGKGPAGFGLPMICAFAYVCTKKRWAELTRLELMSGVLIILGVAIPWYVAMYVRHGSPFTDRLIFHDMFNRAFHHVHDTNEGDDTSFRFYIWQLGYALFPWTGLAPLGLTFWLRRGDAADRGRGDVAIFLFMWFLFAFALFTFMGTKFHHYIFPAVPPVAMLVGVVLDQMIGDEPLAVEGGLGMYLVGLFSGLMVLTAGAALAWPGNLFGFKELHGDLAPPRYGLSVVLVVVGVAMILGFVRVFRRRRAEAGAGATADVDADDPRAFHERRMLAAAVLGGLFVFVLTARDLVIKPEGADQPGAIRLLQLFTYNYRRPWPESLDFSAVLMGFAIVGVLVAVALTIRDLRKHAVAAMLCFSFVWALWGLDVYMVKTAPHWGQHEVIEAYYANRASPQELLVAYQMNWKGENFYTGNHVPAFVSTGSTFTNWLRTQREKGAKVMYFITEHSRVGGLKSEVAAKSYREVTDKVLNNKFVLVRAEL